MWYANVVLHRVVWETTQKATWRQCSTCHRIFDSLETSAMPTTVDLTEKASLCVKNFTGVKNATKSCRTVKGSHKNEEKRCVGIGKSLLTQINNLCYMKRIVDQQEDEAANYKSNNDDSKSVWYCFGLLRNTINPSNRIMAKCLLITITRLRRSILFFNDLKRY